MIGPRHAVTIILPNRHEPAVLATYEALRHLPAILDIADDYEGRGVGWALRKGVQRASTPWVLFAMADGSEDPAALAGMIAVCEQNLCVAVWGDRWGRDGRVTNYPRLKRIANRLGNGLIGLLMRSRYRDWTDLAKAYRRTCLLEIDWSDDFRCAVEIPLRFRRRWLRWVGDPPIVPMRWTERMVGESAYDVRQGLRCLMAVWRVVIYG